MTDDVWLLGILLRPLMSHRSQSASEQYTLGTFTTANQYTDIEQLHLVRITIQHYWGIIIYSCH